MADSNQSRRADYSEFSENDPFAELTRIMGHDPRAPEAAPEAPAAAGEDDFGFDLEKELMGDLDFSQFDEPGSPAADWRDGIEAAGTDDPEFEVDHSVEDLAASIMDTFDADEAELHPHEREAGAQTAPPTMRAVEVDEVPVDEMLERELPGWDAPEAVSLEAGPVEQPASGEAEAALAAEPDFGQADTGSAADVEAFDPIEEAVATAFEPADAPIEYDEAAEAAVSVQTPEDGEAQLAPAPQSSLEDELNALLSAGDEAIEAERAAYDAEPEAAPAAAMVTADDVKPEAGPEEEWHPGVNTFGRANFVAAQPAETAQPAPAGHAGASAMEAELEPVEFADLPDWDEPELLAGDDEPAVAFAAPVEEPEPAAAVQEEDVFTSIFAQALAQEDTDRPSGSTAAELDEVLSHFPAVAPREDVVLPAMQTQAPARDEAPAIETIDVAEAAYAVSDDLDLPEIDYGTPAAQAAPYDEFAGDFADAFDEPGADHAAHPAQDPATWSQATPYANPAHQPATATAAEASGAYALGEGEWQAGDVGLGDDFSFDDDFDQALAHAVVADDGAQQPQRSRRGLVVAAAVAGVAVFGGIGVLGMSLFGGGSDAPAVVRADDEPMKVRPENPGGTVVPNQDSEAYNRVAAGPDTTAPEQEELITTAEEPVDITAEGSSASLPSAIGDGSEQAALAETDPAETSAAPAQPKSEDRIEPAAEEPEGVGASGDLLAVAPRKVRTMIVRPDGTMVPRELPQPQEETVVAAAPLAAPALEAASVPAVEQAAPLAAAEDAGPSVDTPETVAVVPSQRTAPQQAPAAAAQPAAQTLPATPVSAPAAAAPVAAAASEWSMQIASQPTAESAQATYQDLARRYGSVLEGRGVNIVKADIAGKGTYYRVRIPSASRDEAIRLCTQYKSAGGSCFVSR